MADNRLAIVKNFYDFFAVNDVDSALRYISPDVRWMEAEGYPYADRNPYTGLDALLNGLFDRAAEDWTDLVVHVHEMLLLEGNKVLVQGRYTGLFNATGRSMDCQMAHVWTIENDLVTHFQQYANTAHVRDVVTAVSAGPALLN